MSEISSSLYWSMPGPLTFLEKVAESSRKVRALFLSFPEHPIGQPLRAVEGALNKAGIHDPVVLNIQDGMNISVEIGTHFNNTNMPAQSLAHHNHGSPHAVVLNAKGTRAQEHCEKYASEFVLAMDHSSGDVMLVVAIHDGKFKADAHDENFSVIAFDGALKPAEMNAYVAQRMVSYEGPGSTSLLRHLVTEYAGFDPLLAERLAEMDASHLQALPGSLSQILSESPVRWSRCSWVDGTTCSSSKDAHSLYEWYQATHFGPESAHFKRLSERRYWRACLKAIIPWLEERRLMIIGMLSKPLDEVERAAGSTGKISKKIGMNSTLVSRDVLEYNDLAFQARTDEFKRTKLTLAEQTAVAICFSAKRVRDDISHLRKPDVKEIDFLIASMDALVPV